MWDAIVVGAGPAGSAASALLAREGLRVLLLDKSAAPQAKACGEYLSPGCRPILESFDVLDAIRQAGARQLLGMVIHTRRGRTLRASFPDHTPPHRVPLRAISLSRRALDPLLLNCAIRSGATFEPGFQVSDVLWQDGRVTGVRGRCRGMPLACHASFVIGADGRHSVIARRIGGIRLHPWLDRMAIVGYLAGAHREDEAGEIFLGRNRYGILNPLAPDLTNVGLVFDRRDVPRGEDPRRLLWTVAASLPGLADRLVSAKTVAPVRCLGPLARRAARLTAPGALLLGDAAGFLDPFTGAGLYVALRSAELAAQCLLEPTRGGSSAPAHLIYDAAWRREFGPNWRLATLLQRVLRRPHLAEGLLTCLSRRPRVVATLMAALGDLLSPDDLRPFRLLTRHPCASRSRSGA